MATGSKAPADAKTSARGVREITTELAQRRAQHLALLRVVEDDRIALEQAQQHWDAAANANRALAKIADPTGTGTPNPYLPTASNRTRPTLSPEAAKRARALHSMAYVIADLEHELATYSTREQRMEFADEFLAEAGVRMDIPIDVDPLPAAEQRTQDEHARHRGDLLRRAGIILADPTSNA